MGKLNISKIFQKKIKRGEAISSYVLSNLITMQAVLVAGKIRIS